MVAEKPASPHEIRAGYRDEEGYGLTCQALPYECDEWCDDLQGLAQRGQKRKGNQSARMPLVPDVYNFETLENLLRNAV